MGSVDTTSSPAAATLPEFRASARSCSTTIWPRLLLIMMTPSFILAMFSRLMMPVLKGNRGIWRPRTSDRANSSSRETYSTPELQSFVPLAHVVGDDMHPQGRCDGGSVDADVPAAKQAVCLSRQLDQGVVPVAPVRALFPFPGSLPYHYDNRCDGRFQAAGRWQTG